MNDWWKPSRPDELTATPWLSPEATAYLESILTPNMDVIEHGSGGSTLFMAARVKRVMAIENNPAWLETVKAKAPDNVKFGGRLKKSYDLLFIDGEPVTERCKWLTDAVTMVKPGGWIVLDNANRPEYKAERDALEAFADLVQRVDGNVQNRQIHTSFLVTEFWKVRDASRE